MFNKKELNRHVNPRFRAYGKARIDIARRAQKPDDWYQLWKEPNNPFPFSWGKNWKQNIEYMVDDFPAEVGFFIDILGFPVNAFDPDYAMFTSPQGDFYISIVPAQEGENGTPPEAFRIQFMIEDLFDTVDELESRGVSFEQEPHPCQEGSSLYIAYFRTPHGICIDLWGLVEFEDKETIQQSEPDEVQEFTSAFSDREPQNDASESLLLSEKVPKLEEHDEWEELEDDSEEDWGDNNNQDEDAEEDVEYVDDEEDAGVWKIRST